MHHQCAINASEIWTIKKRNQERLPVFEMKCYRRILNIRWQQKKIKNSTIRERIKAKTNIKQTLIWRSDPFIMQGTQITTSLFKGHLISYNPFLIDGEHIPPSTEVRLLGVHFDASFAIDGHIGKMSQSCYHQLQRIREICHQLPSSAATLLVRAFILTRVDYCNSFLWGLPSDQLNRLQMALNASSTLASHPRAYCL